jgi:hypothetical protein
VCAVEPDQASRYTEFDADFAGILGAELGAELGIGHYSTRTSSRDSLSQWKLGIADSLCSIATYSRTNCT